MDAVASGKETAHLIGDFGTDQNGAREVVGEVQTSVRREDRLEARPVLRVDGAEVPSLQILDFLDCPELFDVITPIAPHRDCHLHPIVAADAKWSSRSSSCRGLRS